MRIILFVNYGDSKYFIPGSECYVGKPTSEFCETHPAGGSGTAVIRLAEAFREEGHDVEIAGTHEEVQKMSGDVLIACRDWRVILMDDVKVKMRYLWGQDDHREDIVRHLKIPECAQQVYDRCERVALLSNYQMMCWKDNLNLPVEKVFMISNGVNNQLYNGVIPTVDRPARAYYSSYPTRGLEQLIQAWPFIKSAVPEAELWVFSSAKTYEQEETPQYLEWFEQVKQLPGATYFGGVGQKQLREAAVQCRLLAYPCVFPETSCVAAMEAMAAGCAVVGTYVGGLCETAWRNPMTMPTTEDWLERWAFECARVLVDDEHYLDLARQNQTIARFYDYRLVAKRWLRQIRTDAARQGLRP